MVGSYLAGYAKKTNGWEARQAYNKLDDAKKACLEMHALNEGCNGVTVAKNGFITLRYGKEFKYSRYGEASYLYTCPQNGKKT